MNDTPEAMLRPVDVAAYIGFTTRSVRRWTSLGWLRAVGPRHRPRYRRADVDAFMVSFSEFEDVVGESK